MKVFLAVLSSVALGNVRWDRDGASSHLVGQAVHFFCRKAFGQPIHSFDEIHSCLPDSQVAKTVYCHTLLFYNPPTPNPQPPFTNTYSFCATRAPLDREHSTLRER